MPKSSPARSQSAILTPKHKRPRSSRSLGTPTPSRSSKRLNNIENKGGRDIFSVSPLSKTVLSDNTEIDMPKRQSWWRKVDNSRDMAEVLNNDKPTNEAGDVLEDFELEALSQEKKQHTMDIPESSGSESIGSIVVPQRRLFTQKENIPQNKFGQVIGNRETLTKHNKTTFNDKSLDVGPKNLFTRPSTRTKPVFPSALLNMSLDKTANKTKEPPAEVRGQQKNLFGNRLGTKRKNMFADFVVSESEDDSTIPDIQPKLFAFQKQNEPTGPSSTNSRGFRDQSPASSITTDIEMDDWKLLPSSTMVEYQIQVDLATPGKRARLSKVSELKESTKDSTKQSDRSNSKNKSKFLSPAKNEKADAPENDKSKINNSIGTRKNTSLNKSKGNSSHLKNKSKTENIATYFEEDQNEIDNYPTNIDEEVNEITFGKDKTRLINRTDTLKQAEIDESKVGGVQTDKSVSKNKSKLLSPAKNQNIHVSPSKDKTRDGNESIVSKKNVSQNKSKLNSSQLKNKSKTFNISTNVEEQDNDVMVIGTNADENASELVFGKDRTGIINKTTTLRKEDFDDSTSKKIDTQTKINVVKTQTENINEDEKEISNAKDRTRVINKTVTLNRLSEIQDLNVETNEQQELFRKNVQTEVDQDEEMEENITLTYDDKDQENIDDKTLVSEEQDEGMNDVNLLIKSTAEHTKLILTQDAKIDMDKDNKMEEREGIQVQSDQINNIENNQSKIDKIATQQENLDTLTEATEALKDITKQLDKSALSNNKSKVLIHDKSMTANMINQTSKANLSNQEYKDETQQRVNTEKQKHDVLIEKQKEIITSETQIAVQNKDDHNAEKNLEMQQVIRNNKQIASENNLRHQEKDTEHQQNKIEDIPLNQNDNEQNLEVHNEGKPDEMQENPLNDKLQSDNEQNEEDAHISKEKADEQSENEQEDQVSQEIEDQDGANEQNISEVQNEIEEDQSDNEQQSGDEENQEEEISQEVLEQESDIEHQEDMEVDLDKEIEAQSEDEQEISQELKNESDNEQDENIIEGIDQEEEGQESQQEISRELENESNNEQEEMDEDLEQEVEQEVSQELEDQDENVQEEIEQDLDQEIETQSEGEQDEQDQEMSQEEQSDNEQEESEGDVHQEVGTQSEEEQDEEDQENSQEDQIMQEEQSDNEQEETEGDLDQEVGTQSEGEHDHNDEQDDINYDQGHQETDNTDQENVIDGTDEDHDTTGRNRQKRQSDTVEALRKRDSYNDMASSFTAKGRNTSIRKTSIFGNINVQRDSIGFSDRTEDSSAQGSGWDSHRTTRKTLRQTFGRDFTPRKSLRTLVMEKSAKRQTIINEANAKLMQNSSPDVDNDDFEMDYDDNIENVEPVESDHEQSRILRQAKLEKYLQKVKKENREMQQKIEQQVNSWFKSKPSASGDLFNFRAPMRPAVRRMKASQVPAKPSKTKVRSNAFTRPEELPQELLEDLKYKPPKRFRPSNASWITKRLYKFLETKLEPKYDYKARVRAERLVETIYNFVKSIRRLQTAPLHSTAELKREMARVGVVTTHFDFYNFFNDYLPLEVKIKVVPDIMNELPQPRNGIFSTILE